MSGTAIGGKRAAEKNKQKDAEYLEKYGMTFYQWIGSQGGKTSTGGGFAANRELAKEAGRKGGLASRKTKKGRTKVDYEAALRS